CALKGLDQAAIALRLQVSKSSMSRILSGVQEPKLRMAYDLARLLGVTLDYLVDDSIEFDPSAQTALVNEHEMTILKIARRLGPEATLDRLLGIQAGGAPSETPEPHADVTAPVGDRLGK